MGEYMEEFLLSNIWKFLKFQITGEINGGMESKKAARHVWNSGDQLDDT